MKKLERGYMISMMSLMLINIILMFISMSRTEGGGIGTIATAMSDAMKSNSIIENLTVVGALALLVAGAMLMLFLTYTLIMYPLYRLTAKTTILLVINITLLYFALYTAYMLLTTPEPVYVDISIMFIVVILLWTTEIPLRENGEKMAFKESLEKML